MKKLAILAAVISALISVFTISGAPTATKRVFVCPECGQECDKLVFDKPGICPGCRMKLVEKIDNKEQRISVAVLLFDGAEVIDYGGPWEVFGEAGFKVYGVAEKLEPVHATFGQELIPAYTFADSPPADILLVPGGGVGRALENPQLIKWVQTNARSSTHVMSVCTGAFILARAGLLDGLSATTISGALDNFETFAVKTKVVRDKRYVDNGKVITTAGLSSGIDGAFHLVAKILGQGVAQQTALHMEYHWEPETKFVHAALADKLLPDISDLKGIQGKVLSTEGDESHWQSRTLVTEPKAAGEIVGLIGTQLTSAQFGRGGVTTLAPATDNKSSLKWTFKDRDGGIWNGEGTVESEKADESVVTLKITRAPLSQSQAAIRDRRNDFQIAGLIKQAIQADAL